MAKRTARTTGTIKSRFAKVNGIRLHYLVAGQGEPVVLLHGYAQTSLATSACGSRDMTSG
jgi:pimeloyl-ACP methyl ester carboxylesterase